MHCIVISDLHASTCVGVIPAVPVVAIGRIVFTIIAAMEANKGVYYRYPYTIRLINEAM